MRTPVIEYAGTYAMLSIMAKTNRFAQVARHHKARALARAIREYNAHFPVDPIGPAELSALTADMWKTLALAATSLEGTTVHPPRSFETIREVAAELRGAA